MSEAFIADSSVGVAWAVHSQASEATDQWLDKVAAGTPLVVPPLWPFEVANSLLVLLRRKRILAEGCDREIKTGDTVTSSDAAGLRAVRNSLKESQRLVRGVLPHEFPGRAPPRPCGTLGELPLTSAR